MNKNLLMAVVLTLPVLARAQEIKKPLKGPVHSAIAKAALAYAADKAEENGQQLSLVPLKAAPLLVIFPYGGETDAIATNHTTIAGVKELLQKKADYWTAVGDSLKAEKKRVDAEITALRPDHVAMLPELSKESVMLGRQIRVVDMISDDIAEDAKLVNTLSESAQDNAAHHGIIERKGKVFKALQALK
jgi:hypothetical protein